MGGSEYWSVDEARWVAYQRPRAPQPPPAEDHGLTVVPVPRSVGEPSVLLLDDDALD